MKLHQKIRIYIMCNGLKINSVASKSGIKSTKLYRILDGTTKMTAEDYASICNGLSLDPGYFFENNFADNANLRG